MENQSVFLFIATMFFSMKPQIKVCYDHGLITDTVDNVCVQLK